MPGIAGMLKLLGRVRYTYIQIVPPYTRMFVVGHMTFFFFVPLVHPLMHNQHFSSIEALERVRGTIMFFLILHNSWSYPRS